uniref:MBL fold metallo-hydrolase n=1 Tax=Trichocoleus desertorum TaxID=1481672 RepID=UPI0025B5B89D|nr:MBL fold metallo-hydrolase [Trichocoleus desertorum]
MKRRQFMRYAQAGLLAAGGMGLASGFEAYQAQTSNGLSIKWLGHTSFLFTGSGQRVLTNPFRQLGCTSGYRSPNVSTDLVLISSQLLDEGAVEEISGEPKLLYQPGAYQVAGLQLQGISIDHDRQGGRRFGTNVAWRWQQGGITVLHLGGAAAPISIEQKILMGRPDVLLIPVGGGPKAYNAQEAKQAVQILNPKVIIPTHYRTAAADSASCDLTSVDEFLALMEGANIHQVQNDAITIKPGDLPQEGSVVRVLSYKF